MTRRLVVVAALAVAFQALPARADEQAPAGAPAQTDLRAVPPIAPVQGLTEGATDAGGGSAIFASALWGGLAGAAIGAGVGLIEGGNYGRDIGIGAGAGLLIGGALGAANVFGDSRGLPAARDGLGSTDRDPVVQGRTFRLGGRF